MHYNLQVKYMIQHICTRNKIYHIPSPWVVDLVVMHSFLRVREVEVLGSNLAMGSAWKITSYFRLILTNVLDGVGYTTLTYPDPLLLQALA